VGEFVLRYRVVCRIALIVGAAGLALAGCKNSTQLFQDNNEGGWFSKPMNVLTKPSWVGGSSTDQNVRLEPRGLVAPDELVGADGRCAAPATPQNPEASGAAPAALPSPPPDRPVGSMAGDLASAPMPAGPPPAPNAAPDQSGGQQLAAGGIALGMSECDVVRRAGTPGNVNISAGDKGERRAVLTYLTGNWPGIYTFDNGRLKIVDRAPEPEKPVKPRANKQKAKKPTKPKTVTREIEREYVQ
jgi:hypothetical protein